MTKRKRRLNKVEEAFITGLSILTALGVFGLVVYLVVRILRAIG